MKTGWFNLKTGKTRSWTGSWPVGGFLFFFTSQVITLRRFGSFVLKWKSNPKPKLKSLSHSSVLTFKLRLSSHSRGTPQARSSQARLCLSQARLNQALPQSSSPQSSALSAQERLLHSDALCTAAAALSAQRLQRSLLCFDSLALLFAQQHR